MPIYKMNGKKDGKQQYRVRINYIDSNGKSKQIDRVAYGSAEAKDLERELSQEYKNPTTSTRLTIQQLYDEYISSIEHDIRTTTLDKKKRILNGYIIPDTGRIRIDKLNKQVLQQWKTALAKKELGIRTKQNIYSEFRAMLNYGVKMDYLSKNYLSTLGNFVDAYFEDIDKKLQYYTPDQFKLYRIAARYNAERSDSLTDWGYYIFFCIAFYTGMRKGEINALKWSDIEDDIIHVRRSIAQKVKGDDIETPPKNKSSYRDLQMPLPLIKMLNEHKERQKKEKRFTDDFRVCGGLQCLRDTSISNKNIQFAKMVGLPTIRVHDFRHTHASILVNEGINIQEIARRLGHAKIEMTWNTYAHLYPREEERAVSILNKIV